MENDNTTMTTNDTNDTERTMTDNPDPSLTEAGWAASLKESPAYQEKAVALLEECKAVAADLNDENEIDYQIASLRHSAGAIFLFDERPASLTRVYSQCGYYGFSINAEDGVSLIPLETYLVDKDDPKERETPTEYPYLMNTYGAIKTDEEGKQVSHTVPTLVTKDEGDNWTKYVAGQVETGEVIVTNDGFSAVLDFNPLAKLPEEKKDECFEVFKGVILKGWKAICDYVWDTHKKMVELAERGVETLPEDYEAPNESFWCESGLDEWLTVVRENRLAEGFANQVKYDKRRA